LLSVVKEAFIGFGSGILCWIVTPDLNIATQDGPFWQRAEHTEGDSEPIGISTTVGIYKAKNFGARILRPPVSRGTWPWLGFV
jgi:hypothetical protein